MYACTATSALLHSPSKEQVHEAVLWDSMRNFSQTHIVVECQLQANSCQWEDVASRECGRRSGYDANIELIKVSVVQM